MQSFNLNQTLDSIYPSNIHVFQQIPKEIDKWTLDQKQFIRETFLKLNFKLVDYQRQRKLPARFVEKSIFHISKKFYYKVYQNEAFRITTQIVQDYVKEKFEQLIKQDQQNLNLSLSQPTVSEFISHVYQEVRKASEPLHLMVASDEIQTFKKESALKYYDAHVKTAYPNLPLEDLLKMDEADANEVIHQIIAIIIHGEHLHALESERQEFFKGGEILSKQWLPKASEVETQLNQMVIEKLQKKETFSFDELKLEQAKLIEQQFQAIKSQMAQPKAIEEERKKEYEAQLKSIQGQIQDLEAKNPYVHFNYYATKIETEKSHLLGIQFTNLSNLKCKLEQLDKSKVKRSKYKALKAGSKKLVSYLSGQDGLPKGQKTTLKEIETKFKEIKSLIEQLKKKSFAPLKLKNLRKALDQNQSTYQQILSSVTDSSKAEYMDPKQQLEAELKKVKSQLELLEKMQQERLEAVNQLESKIKTLMGHSLANKSAEVVVENKVEDQPPAASSKSVEPTTPTIKDYLNIGKELEDGDWDQFVITQDLAKPNLLYSKKDGLSQLAEKGEAYHNIYLPSLKLLALFCTPNKKEGLELFDSWQSQLDEVGNKWKTSKSDQSSIDNMTSKSNSDFYWQLEGTRLSLLISKCINIRLADVFQELTTLEIPNHFEVDINKISEEGARTVDLYLANPEDLSINFNAFFKDNASIAKWSRNLQFILLSTIVLYYENNKLLEANKFYRDNLYKVNKNFLKILDNVAVKGLISALKGSNKAFSLALEAAKAFLFTFLKKGSEVEKYNRNEKLIKKEERDQAIDLEELQEWKNLINFSRTKERKAFDKQYNKFKTNLLKNVIFSFIHKHKSGELNLQSLLNIIIPFKEEMRSVKAYIEQLNLDEGPSNKQKALQELQVQQATIVLEYFKLAKGLAPVFKQNENYSQFIQVVDTTFQAVKENPPQGLDQAPFLPWLEKNIFAPMQDSLSKI